MSQASSLPPSGDTSGETYPELSALDQKAPAWLAALAAGICIAGSSAWVNQRDRKNLEKPLQPTAVGDGSWFQKTGAVKRELRFGESVLKEASGEIEKVPDMRMRAVGITDDGALRLYVPEERSNGLEETGGPSWFVKIGPGEFLRMIR